VIAARRVPRGRYHPDKRPADFDSLPAEDQQRFNARFHAVQRAYEAVEAHLGSLGRSHARPDSDP
jgi:DnaJ-class molecular chaperone